MKLACLKLASVPAQCTLSSHLYCWCPLRPEHLRTVHIVTSAAGVVPYGLSISVLGILSPHSISAVCIPSLWLLVCVWAFLHCAYCHLTVSPHCVYCHLTASPHCVYCHLTVSPHCVYCHLTASPHCAYCHLTACPHCAYCHLTAPPHCVYCHLTAYFWASISTQHILLSPHSTYWCWLLCGQHLCTEPAAGYDVVSIFSRCLLLATMWSASFHGACCWLPCGQHLFTVPAVPIKAHYLLCQHHQLTSLTQPSQARFSWNRFTFLISNTTM